ncbi:hypothetical protein [Streptomyces sp. NPDC057438]|uniref:hypothetical protein n=1 Tax=Streptomyces sp. NPDC057438 TaxID=3346133 RepID=UPI0036824EAF
MAKKLRPRPKVNLLLTSVGVILVAVAIVGFFRNGGATTIGVFVVLGAALILMGVFEPRMEGQASISLTGAKWTLRSIEATPEAKQRIDEAEVEIAAGELVSAEDLTP